MKKILFLSLLFLTFSNAEFVFDNKCIDDYFVYNNQFYYHVVGATSYSNSFGTVTDSQIMKGFKYSAGKCVLDSNATALNISLPAYNFLMGLSGLLAGFAFFISVIFAMKRN
jgi:hypothetical protein